MESFGWKAFGDVFSWDFRGFPGVLAWRSKRASATEREIARILRGKREFSNSGREQAAPHLGFPAGFPPVSVPRGGPPRTIRRPREPPRDAPNRGISAAFRTHAPRREPDRARDAHRAPARQRRHLRVGRARRG